MLTFIFCSRLIIKISNDKLVLLWLAVLLNRVNAMEEAMS